MYLIYILFLFYFLAGFFFTIMYANTFREYCKSKDITPQTMGVILGFLWPYYFIQILRKKI